MMNLSVEAAIIVGKALGPKATVQDMHPVGDGQLRLQFYCKLPSTLKEGTQYTAKKHRMWIKFDSRKPVLLGDFELERPLMVVVGDLVRFRATIKLNPDL